ncbi:MAG: hypothetical protein WDN04_18260 [Rhodospirillales bacterium]
MLRRYHPTLSHGSNLTHASPSLASAAWIGADAAASPAHRHGRRPPATGRPPVNNVSWKNPVSGDWSTPADWTGGVVRVAPMM